MLTQHGLVPLTHANPLLTHVTRRTHGVVTRHRSARSVAACAREAHAAAPNASGLERCQELCAGAAVEGLGTTRARRPRFGRRHASHPPCDAHRSAPVRQAAPPILIQRMAARGLATVENVQRSYNFYFKYNCRRVTFSCKLVFLQKFKKACQCL